jgi:signal transduction histidine kinase
MASHELKSPLTTILAYSDLLKRAGSLTDRQVEYITRIQAVTRRMNELVRSLVEQAQADWQAASRWEVCVLTVLAREVADELLPAATAQDLTLRVKLPEPPLYVWGDPSRLRQAIRNVLSNAIKYTPARGQVALALEERGAEACLSVTDTGLGIAPADLPLIFERFYRVRTTDRLDIEGSGLGLSIVKTIVEQHHGQVAVESELGQGSCFRFSLPLFSARPASSPIA